MARPSAELQGCRVLLVEDELLVVMAIENLLEEQGCKILPVASTVAEAMRRISEDDPDVVILDRNLNGDRTTPVGQELVRRRIPFVVMTGYVTGTAEDPALAGVPCIPKPWNDAALLSGIRRVLRNG
jgi:CheY-like chemotaxis protein